MLTTAGLKASEGAEDYGREWSPYVTVRGGWLFGKAKYSEYIKALNGTSGFDIKKSIKNAWSGSAEFGTSYDDRVFVGLELGYFTGKMKDVAGAEWIAAGVNRVDMTWKGDGEVGNFFGACNVTLRYDLNERAFLYGGVGAGIARSRCSYDINGTVAVNIPPNPVVAANLRVDGGKNKWRFLTQAFAGLGMHLSENWSLSVGYRLRYLPGDCTGSKKYAHDRVTWDWKVKQNLSHAAEVGLTYRF